MSDPFVHQIRPRYVEVDMQGVVFNGHYLTYFDDAFTRFAEHVFGDAKEVFTGSDFDCMVVKATLEWTGSAGFDDVVSITVDPVRLGNASFDLRYRAAVGERPVCEGVLTYVSVVRGTTTTQPIPPSIRSGLEERLAR
ncbi:MAG TPA: thioesterase family protein [Acidimicrobiia bacterium]|nr:thioesterase family protein [Acidimicrobiia bacterium]